MTIVHNSLTLSNELASESLQRVLGTGQKETQSSEAGCRGRRKGFAKEEIGGYSRFDGFAGNTAEVEAAGSLPGARV